MENLLKLELQGIEIGQLHSCKYVLKVLIVGALSKFSRIFFFAMANMHKKKKKMSGGRFESVANNSKGF